MGASGAEVGGRGAAPDAAFKYCPGCGARLAFVAEHCPHCGRAFAPPPSLEGTSDKSYGVAVALCGIFGVMGIHHFYIGNYLHGLLDVGLFVLFVYLLFINSPIAFLVLLIDLGHTVYVFFNLIVGKQKDGHGRLIRQPV